MIDLDLDHLTNTQNHTRSPEQRMWIATLMVVCRDATGTYCHSPGESEYAKEWLLADRNPDRVAVCDLANVSEDVVLTWARKTFADYKPNPYPDADKAKQLRKELRRANPIALFGWAEKNNVSALWAIENADCMLSQSALSKIVFERVQLAPVHPRTLGRELDIPPMRVYQMLLQMREEQGISPLGNGSHGYPPKHYLNKQLANGGCHVNTLAESLGVHARYLRGMIDNERRRGQQIVCVRPGTFQFVGGVRMTNDSV